MAASPVFDHYEHKFADVADGITLHYIDVGPRDATPLVLVHGWPDLCFGWRHQIGPLSKKYRVIAADMRGHGLSSTPKELTSYGMKNITCDLARLLDILEIEKAVFFGHDWGGSVAWRMCLFQPHRVLAAGAVGTPFIPPAREFIELDALVKVNPSLAYWKLLSQTEVAGALMDQSPRRVFTRLFRRHDELKESVSVADAMQNLLSDDPMYTVHSDLLTDEELDVYVNSYTKTGFQSTLHWYATRHIDFADEKELPMTIAHKTLFIAVPDDRVVKPEMAAHMPKIMPNLELASISGAGHWILWQQREKVTETLLNWLDKVTEEPKP